MAASALFYCILVAFGLYFVGSARVDVETGVFEARQVLTLAEKQLETSTVTDLPFVTISYAQTLDGSIAPLKRARLDISSKTSFRLLHSLRARHEGVLVGINTVVADQPRLNVRDPLPGVQIPETSMQPRPVVIDSQLRLLDVPNLQLLRPIVCSCLLDFTTTTISETSRGIDQKEHQDETWLSPGPGSAASPGLSIELETRWVRARILLESLGGTLVACKRDALTGQCDLRDCLRRLRAPPLNLRSLLVEGGAGVIQSVLAAGLAHQAVVTLRPCFLGGYRSMISQLQQPVSLHQVSVASVGGDVVMHGVLDTAKQLSSPASASGSASGSTRASEEENVNREFARERPLVSLVIPTVSKT